MDFQSCNSTTTIWLSKWLKSQDWNSRRWSSELNIWPQLVIIYLIFFLESLIPGAGAYELAASQELFKFKDTIKGKARLGVQAYAEAILIIPKTIGN